MSSSKDGSGTIVITGNHAVSYAVKNGPHPGCRSLSHHPAGTQVVELLSKFCEDGIMDARFIKVESEHTSMASLIGGLFSRSPDLYSDLFPGAGPDA